MAGGQIVFLLFCLITFLHKQEKNNETELYAKEALPQMSLYLGTYAHS